MIYVGDLPGEVWKSVVGYEGLYEISTCGRVKSLPKIRFTQDPGRGYTPIRIIKHEINRKNKSKAYCRLKLHNINNFKWFNVHRLVAIAFIPNPENKPQVNHINGIKTDNRVENLEWCTASENVKHAIKEKLIVNSVERLGKRAGITHGRSILSENDVYAIRKRYDNGEQPIKIWENYPLIGYSGVVSVCCRKTWKHLKEL